MGQEFEGDLRDAVFWGAMLNNATFRDVDLTGARISHAWLVDVSIDALVERLVVNGVDVTDYVNERDPWFPLRAMLRPTDPAGMRQTWALLEAEWAATIEAATALPDSALHESVGGEWSFVQTLRHLLFAMDKWFTVPLLGEDFHRLGMPNSGSVDVAWPGLDQDATPTSAEVLAARAARGSRFSEYLAALDGANLDADVDVIENGPHPRRECILVVFEEEFWHLRYARRDLAQLSSMS